MVALITSATVAALCFLYHWGLFGHLMHIGLCLGIVIGLWSHLVIDIVQGEVIYTIPTTRSLKKILSHTPVGPDFIGIGSGGTAIKAQWSTMNRISDGGLAWPYWRRFC
jgi:hypothetical protein